MTLNEKLLTEYVEGDLLSELGQKLFDQTLTPQDIQRAKQLYAQAKEIKKKFPEKSKFKERKDEKFQLLENLSKAQQAKELIKEQQENMGKFNNYDTAMNLKQTYYKKASPMFDAQYGGLGFGVEYYDKKNNISVYEDTTNLNEVMKNLFIKDNLKANVLDNIDNVFTDRMKGLYNKEIIDDKINKEDVVDYYKQYRANNNMVGKDSNPYSNLYDKKINDKVMNAKIKSQLSANKLLSNKPLKANERKIQENQDSQLINNKMATANDLIASKATKSILEDNLKMNEKKLPSTNKLLEDMKRNPQFEKGGKLTKLKKSTTKTDKKTDKKKKKGGSMASANTRMGM